MTTVWIELSRVHLWGLQVGTFHPRCFVDEPTTPQEGSTRILHLAVLPPLHTQDQRSYWLLRRSEERRQEIVVIPEEEALVQQQGGEGPADVQEHPDAQPDNPPEELPPQIGADDEAENVQESGMEDEDDETGSQETEDNSSQEIEEASDRHTSVHTGSDDDDLSKVQFATPKPHQSTKTPLAVGQRDKKKGAKKKKTSEDNMLEIQVLKNMSDSLKTLQTKTNHADDGIDIFSHNVSRKLRMIADPRLQFLVQEEIDRVISNGLKQYWSTSGDVGNNQSPLPSPYPSSYYPGYTNRPMQYNYGSASQSQQFMESDSDSSQQSFTQMLNL
ncbi:UNVERIFIED_CONTAM: hypothetical protein FKN15_009684 [Acipenser sinensis]